MQRCRQKLMAGRGELAGKTEAELRTRDGYYYRQAMASGPFSGRLVTDFENLFCHSQCNNPRLLGI